MKTTANTSYILPGRASIFWGLGLLLSGGTLLLPSCTQEETPARIPDGADRRIIFSSTLPELTTRAAGITKDLAYFNITAFDVDDSRLLVDGTLNEYFADKKIEKTDGADRFASDECIWPELGREDDRLHFFAYYPELPAGASLLNSSTAADASAIGYGISGYSVAADIAEQVDFVTAYTTGSMTDNYFSGINLKFRHQLCRVEVMAKGEHKSCDIEIAGVSIGSTPMQGTFDFQTSSDQTSSDADGKWTPISKGNATYIFREGDAIVKVVAGPVSIMGSKIDEANDNCAMLIPSNLAAWDYAKDAGNTGKGLYLNVLLRIIDKPPTTNKGKQQYPYYDNSQGLNALNVPIVLLAVDTDGKVTANLGEVYKEVYKDESGNYYTDSAKTTAYTVPEGITVKEFGWAAIPISGDWEPGKVYTYTLDYTYGIGVHGPETPGSVAPRAGDPIISDRVGVSLGFKDWTTTTPTGVVVPGN